MHDLTSTCKKIRFGPYEADLRTGELRKNGVRVKLQDRPFEILMMLLEQPGELVTRDEMRVRLWPDGTFVDFDHNIGNAVRKLREALCEIAADPRYVETVGRRGYRFVAEVQRFSDNGHQSTVLTDSTAAELGSAELGSPAMARSAQEVAIAIPAPRSRKLSTRSRALLAAMAMLVIATVGGYFVWWSPQHRTSQASARIMLAVLPFENLTGDAAQDYLSDGVTEEMISQLGNLDPRHLAVIARTSVMHYKNSQTPLDQVGRELGVQYVIEGSVRRDSNQVRVTAQLIQTKDQTHLWARQYDRELKGLLVLQGEIAQEIADEIQLTLGDHKSAAVQSAHSPQPYEAYDLYLKGQYFFSKRTVLGLEEAAGYFQQAIAKDPNYARAYAGLADSYALMAGYNLRPQSEFIPKARAAALKALEIDPNLPEAHTALALIVQNYDWDWQTAEKEFRRAIELNPNYATAHHWYAEHLMWRGRFDEALQESERARQLDPLSLIIAADNGAILFFSRQYDRAIEKWRSVLDMDPDFPRAHLIRAAYVEKGMFTEALADTQAYRRLNSPWYWANLAEIYGRSGRKVEAQRALKELLQLNRREPVDPNIVADAYADLGDKNQALDWLEEACARHSIEFTKLKVSPAYDPLRGDPRFQDLLLRVGFAK